MCRSIKPLFNFEPPVSDADIQAAALQFVRKVSGFNTPSRANQAAFQAAVDEIAATCTNLLSTLTTNAPTRNRSAEEARRAEERRKRFPAAPQNE